MIAADGTVRPFGVAPPAAPSATWPQWDVATSLALAPGSGGVSGVVLDAYGGRHPFAW